MTHREEIDWGEFPDMVRKEIIKMYEADWQPTVLILDRNSWFFGTNGARTMMGLIIAVDYEATKSFVVMGRPN